MQMKNYILIFSIMFASLTTNACKNCGCRADKKSKSEHKHENDSQSHANVDLTESTVYWKGAKLTGSHEGTIDILSAHLHFNDKVFEGGEIIIDMNSINCTDLSGDSKKNIEGHLKDEDFFFSEEYPTSKLVMKKVKKIDINTYEIEGDMTIRGITNLIKFKSIITNGKANAKLKIDRTKYGVKYASKSFIKNIGDKMIYDEFDLEVNLTYIL